MEEEWSGASPTPPSGGLPISGAPPSPSTDDARSGSPGSYSPPPTDSETEQTDLLSLWRDYHRAATQVMMSSHHLEFLGKCKEASHVPPGLHISLRPQVYASNTSHVEESIKKIINSAQDEIIQALCTHYNSVLEHAQNILDQVSSTLSSSLSPSSLPGSTPPAAHGEDQHKPGEEEETAGYQDGEKTESSALRPG